MAAGARRTRRELAEGFGAWLSARGGQPVTVTVTRPQAGLSSETVFVEPDVGPPLVVRLPPPGEPLFPDYDLERQRRVQALLGATPVPVAEPLALETDAAFVGAPFLVMPRIPGRTLTTAPAYPGSGWLHDAAADVQTRVLEDFVRMLATIHRLDVTTLDLGELTGGGPDLDGMLDYWERYLDWATTDASGAEVYREAFRWLRAHQPSPAPSSLLWGDPQLTNLVYDDDARIAAVLDWEMTTVGPAEVDLGWFLALHEGACDMVGTRLPGDPGRDRLVEVYAEALGRPPADLHWFELFAHARSGAIVLRVGELMARAGVPNTWTDDVPQPRHVRRLMLQGA
jgi:aminoglycoside phosphotransferase (APT) family kinase protein